MRPKRRSMSEPQPTFYMDLALQQAQTAASEGEVPVGAVLALPGGKQYAAYNRSQLSSPLQHAEMEVLSAALSAEGRHGLLAATLYVTAEPCLMCLGAMAHARIGGLVYACEEPRFGGVDVLRALWKDGRYPHRFPIASGLREKEARKLLQDFFAQRRKPGSE